MADIHRPATVQDYCQVHTASRTSLVPRRHTAVSALTSVQDDFLVRSVDHAGESNPTPFCLKRSSLHSGISARRLHGTLHDMEAIGLPHRAFINAGSFASFLRSSFKKKKLFCRICALSINGSCKSHVSPRAYLSTTTCGMPH